MARSGWSSGVGSVAAFAGLVVACGVSLPPPAAADGELPVSALAAAPGFRVAVWARVPGARSLALAADGTVFVGTRGEGSVWAVRDDDSDGQADRTVEIASGLRSPNGVAVRDGDLYVAEIHRVLRFDDVVGRLDDPPAPVVVRDDFPTDAHHGWKFIRFGPDGKLYVPVGAPCNVCLEDDPIFASIMRMAADGTGREIFAHGVRNTVGFDWHPETGELWFTDNGRDWLGDDLPPDELNRAPEAGLHFGFPFCHGGDLTDPELGHRRPCSEFVPPVAKLGPHVAALGMRFYTGAMFPEEYRGDILIAEHGSWNRSTKIGYRVTRIRLDGDRVVAYQPFLEGWLDDGEVWGRPVDVQVLDDGSLLVSDDHAGAIYRVTWSAD